MVDVTGKPVTARLAEARCRVVGAGAAVGAAEDDVLGAARLAGIQGGKQTPVLVPLCHPIPVDALDVALRVEGDDVAVSATAGTLSRTGIEMEALTACALAALSVLSRVLPESPGAYLDQLTVWRKTGGRSGDWQRVAAGAAGMRLVAAGGGGPTESERQGGQPEGAR